ncbi:MAG: hypothetical protein EA373_03755, partial [Oceanospirillales bacterium]
ADGSTTTTETVFDGQGGSTETTTTKNADGDTISISEVTTQADGISTITETVFDGQGGSTETTTVKNADGDTTSIIEVITQPDGSITINETEFVDPVDPLDPIDPIDPVRSVDLNSTTDPLNPETVIEFGSINQSGSLDNITAPSVTNQGGDTSTSFTSTDGNNITVSLSSDGIVTTTTQMPSGQTTSRQEMLDFDALPVRILELSISIESFDTGDFMLIDEVRMVSPDIVSILLVSGQRGSPLPEGLSYNQETGQLLIASWASWDAEQQPVFALVVDSSGDLQLIRIFKAQRQ